MPRTPTPNPEPHKVVLGLHKTIPIQRSKLNTILAQKSSQVLSRNLSPLLHTFSTSSHYTALQHVDNLPPAS